MKNKEKIYFIQIDPEDKTPGVLCRIMNKINYYITSNGGVITLDSCDADFTHGKMAFTLGNSQDLDATLCFINSISGVSFF